MSPVSSRLLGNCPTPGLVPPASRLNVCMQILARTNDILCRGPCSKIIKNFKMVATEHRTRGGALLSEGSVCLRESHSCEASPGVATLH